MHVDSVLIVSNSCLLACLSLNGTVASKITLFSNFKQKKSNACIEMYG